MSAWNWPGLDYIVNALVVDNYGYLWAGGSFTNVNGVSRNFLTRLTANGSVDLTFNPGAICFLLYSDKSTSRATRSTVA